MHKLFIFFFIFLIHSLLGQEKSTIVEYNLIQNNFTESASNNFLYLGKKDNIFLLYGSAGTELKFEDIGTNFKNSKIGIIINYLPNNTFFFTGYRTPPIKYFTVDVAPVINWKIKEEYKNILGFQCQKATGTFRGRIWTAYFTLEIPSQLGPWKIGGLPGLVLQAISEDGEFNYIARRIIRNSELEIPKEIFVYIDEKKDDIISFRDYIEKENEFTRNLINEQLSSMPVGTTLVEKVLRHSQPEIMFEWETQPEKP